MKKYFLYKKTHNVTGLKYLGQTQRKDPHMYTGSGTYWINHLQIHGYDYTTEILKECISKEELKYWGEYYSNLWDVVNSKDWANLTTEKGDGGSVRKGRKNSDEWRQKINEYWNSDNRQKASILEKGKNLGENNGMHGKIPWNKGNTGGTIDYPKHRKSTKGISKPGVAQLKWYNNGFKNTRKIPGQEPEGFVEGRLPFKK